MHNLCAHGVQSACLWQDGVLWQNQHAQLCDACVVGLRGLSIKPQSIFKDYPCGDFWGRQDFGNIVWQIVFTGIHHPPED